MNLLKRSAFACLLMFGLCFGAHAEDESESGWKWRLAPFNLWLIQLDGDTSLGSGPAPITINLSDIFVDIEGAFSANFQGIHDNRWGFLVDLTWIDISSNLGPLAVDFESIRAEVDLFYRVPIGRQAIDWIIGARYSSQALQAGGLPMPPASVSSIKSSETWIDPLLGIRWSTPMSEKWKVLLRGDVGGFGVGSDFAWQALAIIDWQPWKHASIDAGFRALGVDYEEGSGDDRAKSDTTIWGPLIGFTLTW
jgi:hypothetical protein